MMTSYVAGSLQTQHILTFNTKLQNDIKNANSTIRQKLHDKSSNYDGK